MPYYIIIQPIGSLKNPLFIIVALAIIMAIANLRSILASMFLTQYSRRELQLVSASGVAS